MPLTSNSSYCNQLHPRVNKYDKVCIFLNGKTTEEGQVAFQKVPDVDVPRWSIKYLTSFSGLNMTWGGEQMTILNWVSDQSHARQFRRMLFLKLYMPTNQLGFFFFFFKYRYWISQSKVGDTYSAFLISGQMMLLFTTEGHTLNGKALELFFS